MDRRPRNTIALFIFVSLFLHGAAYELFLRLRTKPQRPANTALNIIPLLKALPPPVPKTKPESESEPKPKPKPESKSKQIPKVAVPKPGVPRFRPTHTPKPKPKAKPVTQPKPAPKPKPKPKPALTRPPRPKPRPKPTAPLPARAPAPPNAKPQPETPPKAIVRHAPRPKPAPEPKIEVTPMTHAEHEGYRRELLADFAPSWQEIPDLVVAASPDVQRAVSRFYGMALIAYPKGVKNPAYVILIDEDAGKYKYTHEFDFRRYSNRVKDRTHVESYARLIKKAKSKLALPEELTIASLIPAEADLYFAAKQMAAVHTAGLEPEDVIRTEGRYGLDSRGRYCLIIDRLITRDGKVIHVADPERRAAKVL